MDITITKKIQAITTPETVNFTALLANSDVNSLPLQSRFIELLNEEFTEEELKMYIANLYMYLNYNSTTDYPINLETVYKMIGFANKGNAKKTLESNFVKDEDYKIIITKESYDIKAACVYGKAALPSKNLGGSGLNKEDIMLNVDTFKSLCMLVKTPEGKKIRKYYIKLENVNNKITKEQLENKNKELMDKEYQLEQKQIELDNEKKNKNWLLNRRYNNSKPGDTIYLYKDYKDDAGKEFIYKIGKTKNISERETEYSNTSKSGKIVYIQYCLNCDLTEKILHHILDKYRLVKNQEWFNFTEELAIQTIKSIIYIMDSQMENIEEFIPELYKHLNIKEIPLEIKKEDKKKIEKKSFVNPKDFDKFINECCELHETGENFVYKPDLKMAHRIWASGSQTKEIIKLLSEYLDTKFKSSYRIIDDIKRNVYLNVTLKPLLYRPDITNLDYEQFIVNKCKVDYEYRISYTDFFNYFTEWKRNDNNGNPDPHFKLQLKYRRSIQEYLENKFVGGRVYISSTGCKSKHLYGVYGLGISDNNFGKKPLIRTNKCVVKCNLDGEILQEWQSLSAASRDLNISVSTLSNHTRHEKNFGDYVLKYK